MRDYFFGWYFKNQSADRTLAVIPAWHRTGGRTTCSIQIITDEQAWFADYPSEKFIRLKGGFGATIGGNYFGPDGLRLDITKPGLVVTGELRFGPFTPIRGDIMGPFRFVPFMQCRHSVISMRHSVTGRLTVNGDEFIFRDAYGYIEGDRGSSFPSVYSWTQCLLPGGRSLMLSVADIPFGPFNFTGVIGFVYDGINEYRIATYRGAKVVRIRGREIVIRQKQLTFTARMTGTGGHALKAPVTGAMARTIRENASCAAEYILSGKDGVILSEKSDRASFEYEYPEQETQPPVSGAGSSGNGKE